MNPSFGHWLREAREKQGLNLQDLAALSGVDAGTISRIENGKSSPTLGSAIHMAQGLGMTIGGFVNAFPQVKSPAGTLRPESQKNNEHISADDLKKFVEIFLENPRRGTQIFLDLLNYVYRAYAAKTPTSDAGVPPFFAPYLAGNERLFVEQDIAKLLASNPIFSFEINYPVDLSSQVIKEIFLSGGALTYEDIGAYIRRLRQERALSIRELDLPEKISQSDWSRFEAGAFSRVKLEDVIALDRALGEDGIIFAMYWQADQVYSLRFDRSAGAGAPARPGGWTKLEARLVLDFVRLARWLRVLDAAPDWLNKMRASWS